MSGPAEGVAGSDTTVAAEGDQRDSIPGPGGGEFGPVADSGGLGHRVAGLVLFSYVLAWMVRVVLLDAAPDVFERVVEASGSLAARLVAAAVWTALLFHGLNGLRLVALAGPHGPRWDRTLRPAVLFWTLALAVPGWALLLRPWLEDGVR